MRIVWMGARVRSSCGKVVGTVVGLSNNPPCRRCNETPAARIEISWPDGKRAWYCANGIIIAGGRVHDEERLLPYFKISD
jgi:hypothetical protein